MKGFVMLFQKTKERGVGLMKNFVSNAMKENH